MSQTRTALALSGGGHRASLWGLGALLYLADTERNGQVVSIASVSGGSLTNGAIGQRIDYRSATANEVRAIATDIGRLISGRGTLFGWTGTMAYLVTLFAGLVLFVLVVIEAVANVPASVDVAGWVKWLAVLILVLGWLRLWALRGAVTARAFEHTLLDRSRPTTLDGLHTSLDHVICATDLHAGHHAYFSSEWVCAYQFGHGGNGNLTLRRAMQASAAFPPIFPVAWITTKRFGFTGQDAKGARRLALTDGGVYDNLGDQWAQGMSNREHRWREAALGFREADELIVVNASAGLAWHRVWAMRIPILGAFAALLRDKSVLYDNGTSVRRQELVTRFDAAELSGEGLRGALVHIEQTPYTVPMRFKDADAVWPQRAQRARDVLDKLAQSGLGDKAWEKIARENAAVATTLVGFSPDVCVRLLYHSYVLSMVNLHVICGYPLRPIPAQHEFEDLVRSKSPPAPTDPRLRVTR